MRWRALAALGAGVAVIQIAACSPASEHPPETATPSVPSATTTPFPDSAPIGCNVIATASPGRDYLVVADRVAFGGANGPLQLTPEQNRAGQFFAKTGLAVRSGHRLELSVPSAFRAREHIGWGSPPVFASSTTMTSECAAAVTSDWATFPGGLDVTGPGCYPIDVAVDGSTTRVRLSIGTACE